MKIITNYGENPIEKIVDSYMAYGELETENGRVKAYAVTRRDCYAMCETLLRHFILNHGSDDLLPTFGPGTDQLIKNYVNGDYSHFPIDKTPTQKYQHIKNV